MIGFTIVTKCQLSDSMQARMATLEFVSIPNAYLVYMGCDSLEEYLKSLVHVSPMTDLVANTQTLIETKYCKRYGTCLFRSFKTMKTAILSFGTHETLLEDTIVNVTTITSIQWQEHDESVSFFSQLNAKVRLNVIQWREYIKDNVGYISVPMKDVEISENLKYQLRFLKCELGVTVSYPGSVKETCGQNCSSHYCHRSLLIPAAMIVNKTSVEHTGYYAVLEFAQDSVIIIHVSTKMKDNFGWEEQGSFLQCIQHNHTSAEVNRIKYELLPKWRNMSVNDSGTCNIEFTTNDGKKDIEITEYKINQTAILLVINHP